MDTKKNYNFGSLLRVSDVGKEVHRVKKKNCKKEKLIYFDVRIVGNKCSTALSHASEYA